MLLPVRSTFGTLMIGRGEPALVIVKSPPAEYAGHPECTTRGYSTHPPLYYKHRRYNAIQSGFLTRPPHPFGPLTNLPSIPPLTESYLGMAHCDAPATNQVPRCRHS